MGNAPDLELQSRIELLTQARVVGEAPLDAIAAPPRVGSLHFTRTLEQFRQQVSQSRRRVETFLPARHPAVLTVNDG